MMMMIYWVGKLQEKKTGHRIFRPKISFITFISGCSPRGTGTALLHKGQTGTWMS